LILPYQKHQHKWTFLNAAGAKKFSWCKGCGSLRVETLFGKVSYRLSNSYKASLPKVADGLPTQEEKETGAED